MAEPPKPTATRSTGEETGEQASRRDARAPARLVTLKARPEFLRVRGGRRWSARAFVIECKPAADATPQLPARFGLTVTKAMGNAVVRNRIRRRLKDALRRAVVGVAAPATDYVVIARAEAATLPFEDLCRQMRQAVERLARPPGADDGGRRPAATKAGRSRSTGDEKERP